MPRKLRIQYPGAIYHLMNRGDRREKIFKDDQDRQRFLESLAQEFKEELLAQVHERRRDHYGAEPREADLQHAERVLQEELSRRGLTEAGLALRRKGDPQKVELAGALRARTTMTLKWIAQRLNMGHGPTSQIAWSKSARKMKSVNSYDRPQFAQCFGVVRVGRAKGGGNFKDMLASIALAPWHPNLQVDSVKANRQSLHTPGPFTLANHITTSVLRADIKLVQRLHRYKDIAAPLNLSSCGTVTLGNTKYLMQQCLFHRFAPW